MTLVHEPLAGWDYRQDPPVRLILTVAAAQYELATVTALMESVSRIVETWETQGGKRS